MATYDSIHTGEEIDNAVDLVQANASKGDASTPIYFDAEGNAVPITKSNSAIIASTDLITSGAVYNGLATKYNKADISTDINLGTSDTVISSQGAVKDYVDTQVATRQVPVTAGDYVKIENNVISLDNTDDFLTVGELNNKVSYFENTKLKEGETLIEKMEAAKRSTFDLSKFTVVESPNITNDGIASGFSGSNRIKTNFNYTGGAMKTRIGFYYTFDNDGANIIDLKNGSSQDVFRIFMTVTGNLVCYGAGAMSISTSEYSPSENDFIICEVVINSNNTLTFTVNNITKSTSKSLTSSSTIVNALSPTNIFYFGNANGYEFYSGSIDLKQFSITVDGVEVFNGNKTGIDTIKPDNYTVAGTPAISADGVASGFSSSNYIKSSQISFHNNIKMMGKYIYKDINALQRLFSGTSDARVFVRADKSMGMWNATQSMLTIDANRLNLVEGDVIFYLIESDNTSTTLTVQINDKDPVSNTVELPFITQSESFYLGVGQNGEDRWQGSTDLNSFKIYVSGNLIYQPCLKIPYTWTSEGKKIVDSNYRSRVIDEYEQAGFTPYYTLSDTDCTLPTCKESDIVASYENGITKWVQYADFTLKQQGSCSADTTVTLPKKFRDTNYSVTVPYSNKQATSFTPTQAGDWIAIGKTSL